MSTKVGTNQGGTTATTLTGVLIGAGTAPVTGLALGAGQSIRRNAGDTAYEAYTPGGGGGTVVSVVGTANRITVDNTDPANPILNTGANIATLAGSETFTNKTLTTPVINSPTGIVKGDVGLGNVDNTSDATKNAAAVTLTNKTIALGSNTISGTLAEFNAALTGADFATGGGTVTGASSGTNTGDQTSIVGITGTKAQFDTAVTDGNFLYVGDVTQYTDEMAQDATGAMVDASLVYVDATPLLTRAALTGAITASQGSNTTALGSFTMAQLDTAVSDGNVVYQSQALGTPSSGVATNLTNVGLVGTGLGNVTVANTTTETTLATISIPGGTLGTANAVRITLFLDAMTSISEGACNLKLKYGGTTLVSGLDFYNNTGGTIPECNGTLTAILYANGATNSQEGVLHLNAGKIFAVAAATGNPIFNYLQAGTAAEDSTGALNLVITAQWSGANASNTITMVNYLVEKIR